MATDKSTSRKEGFNTTSSRPRPMNAMVGSARRVTLSERPKQRKTEEWQKEAWTAFDAIGEVKHAMYYVANHLAKVRLFPALVPSDPREGPSPDDDEIAHAAIFSLKGHGGGYGEILKEAAVNLFVPGECWLLGMGQSTIDDEIESWEIRSTDEFEVKENTYLLRDTPNGAKKELSDSDVVAIRIWLRHPRWGDLPDSPLRGVLSSCEEIMRVERVIRGAAKSRAAGPGLLLIPEEASFGTIDVTGDEAADAEAGDPFTKELIETMVEAIKNEGSASAVVPIVLRAPSDVLKEIRKVDLSIDIDTELIKLDRALTRLAQGLPLPPEIVTGKSGLNHWTSFGVDENTVSAYVEPLAVPIVDALTTEYYREYLIEAGMSKAEANRRMIWYDPTPLITRPNRSADADFGLDHNAISDRAWRRMKGMTEEDAPTDIEKLLRLVVQRGSFDPIFTQVLLKALGMTEGLPEPIEVIQQPPSPQPERAPGAPTQGPPDDTRPKSLAPPKPSAASLRRGLVVVASAAPDGAEIGSRLADIDRELATRLHTSADAALRRTLERTCATVISKVRHKNRLSTLIADIPKLEAPARIGRLTLASEGIRVERIIDGSFDTLIPKFRDWVGRAYSRASRILGTTPTDYSSALDAACSYLISELSSLAIAQLFPEPADPDPFGEIDGTNSVPFSLVRRTLALAGGADLSSSLFSDRPLGGVATGVYIFDSLHAQGGYIEGWEWVYGHAARTREFEPHADLDGYRFTAWNDDLLANRTTWPATPYYSPGDHDACTCAWFPILSLPSTSSASVTTIEPADPAPSTPAEPATIEDTA